jgi:hypothetical protein
MSETLICETIISGTVLRMFEHQGAALPFLIRESTVGNPKTICHDAFATIDAATQAYLDRRRELRSDRGL